MEHLKLYKQMQESDPSIDARWEPELKRLVDICQKNYKGNWQTMYHEYVSVAASKDTGKHSPEQLRDMRRDTALILVIRQARGDLNEHSTYPEQKKVSEVNLENKVNGIRIEPRQVGGEREYTLLREALYEAHKAKLDITDYEVLLVASKPKRGLGTQQWLGKVAVVRLARRNAESLGGKLEYHPQSEGLYVMFDPYAEHGQGD